MNVSQIDFHALAPVIALSVTILLVLVVDVFLPNRLKWMTMPVALVGIFASLGAALTLIGQTPRSTFDGMFVMDNFTLVFQIFFLAVAALVTMISLRYMREGGFYQGEYYFLLLTAFLGCLLMPASRDILMLFVSLELVSAPGFLMAAFRKNDIRSNEAGVKFFLIGVLSTAIMLYGMSMIYGITHATRLDEIAKGLQGLSGATETLALASILFVVAGFAFKVSAFPFQFWSPDTYEGSPVPVTSFLATASNAAGFAGLLQLMFIAFVHQSAFWVPLFALMSIATMTIGNLIALRQTQVVRLLAYSGIAQAGYILLPFALVTSNAAANKTAFTAAMVYILIYGIMTIGAYAVVVAVSRFAPGLLIRDFAGLVKRAPLLAIGMTLFMISLGGIPPSGGFWAKIFIFGAAVERGGSLGIWLAVAMLVNSVISIYYYFAIPKQMIFQKATDESALRPSWTVNATVALTSAALLVVFVVPGTLASLAKLASLV